MSQSGYERGNAASRLHKLIARLSRPNRTKHPSFHPGNRPDLRPVFARLNRPGLNPEDSPYAYESPEGALLRRRTATGMEERAAQDSLREQEPGRSGPERLKRQTDIYTKEQDYGKTLAEKLRQRSEEPIPEQMEGKRISFKPRKLNEDKIEDIISPISAKLGHYYPGNREGIQEMLFHRENPYGALPITDDVKGKESDTDVDIPETKMSKSFKKSYVKELGTTDPQEQQEVLNFIELHPELMKGAIADLMRARKFKGGGEIVDVPEEGAETEAEPDDNGELVLDRVGAMARNKRIGARRESKFEKVGLPISKHQVMLAPGATTNEENTDQGFAEEESPSAPAPIMGQRPKSGEQVVMAMQQKMIPKSLRKAELDERSLEAIKRIRDRVEARSKRNNPRKGTLAYSHAMGRKAGTTSQELADHLAGFPVSPPTPGIMRYEEGKSGRERRKHRKKTVEG